MKKKSQSFHTTIRLLFVLRGRMFVWTCDQVRHVLWKEADNTFTAHRVHVKVLQSLEQRVL